MFSQKQTEGRRGQSVYTHCWIQEAAKMTFDPTALVSFKKITLNRSEINKDIGNC